MVLREIYSHPIHWSYKASLISKASIFQLISLLLTIVCPLLIAFRSQGFWIKTNTYREQPEVHFKHEFLFLLQSKEPDQYFVWSTFPGLNKIESNKIRMPVVYSREIDNNRNGKPDQLVLKVKFPLQNNEPIHSIQMALIFDYKLSLHSRFRMESMIYVNEQTLTPAKGIKINGDMNLFQRIPLWYRGVDDRFNRPVINGTSLSADSYLLSKMLGDYFGRNVSTELNPKMTIWTPAPFVTDSFQLEINVNYIEQEVLYYCGFWELIKWGWVQYLSVFFIFLFFITRIREFVFRNRIVATVPENKRRSG